jgi:hypothetical protein
MCRAVPDVIKIGVTALRSALQSHTLLIKFIRFSRKPFPVLWHEYSGYCDVTFSLYGRDIHMSGSVEGLYVEIIARGATY